MVKFGVLDEAHGVRLLAEFRFDRFILSASGGEDPQILPLLHFSILW